MSKYCKAYAFHVTYLDCMECETKECKRKQIKHMKEIKILPDQEVFLVFASKREKYSDNIICKCRVRNITVYDDRNVYSLELLSVVLGKKESKNVEKWVTTFMCENNNINTGIRCKPNRYPVFTTKESCIKWLKQS